MKAGNYMVILEVENEQMCTSKDTFNLLVNKDYTCWIPNAFTPNNDGLDDLFMPIGNTINDYFIFIYNSWGELIFENKNNGWNGELFNGLEAQTGVYSYAIYTTDENGKHRNYHGEIHLLR